MFVTDVDLVSIGSGSERSWLGRQSLLMTLDDELLRAGLWEDIELGKLHCLHGRRQN